VKAARKVDKLPYGGHGYQYAMTFYPVSRDYPEELRESYLHSNTLHSHPDAAHAPEGTG